MEGPLSGVRVIEMGTMAALPAGAAILADWGAEVIKVEDPAGGDPARVFNVTPTASGDASVTPLWEQANRNKKSVTIDTRLPEGRAAFLRLIAASDVFVTSMRPASLERAGLTYEELKEVNPRLIYTHLSGFGRQGDDNWRPGYDALCFWARSGLALSLAEPGAGPVGQRPALGDHTTSIAVAAGVAAALFAREKTGRGQEVQASLFHTGLWVTSMDLVTAGVSKTDVMKMSRGQVLNPLTTTYQTSDGWLQLVNLQMERFWEPFCRAVDRTDLIEDPRFKTREAQIERAGELVEIFQGEFAKRNRAEWIERLDAEGVRWGTVQTTLEATEDKQAWDNGYFHRIEHPDAGTVDLVTSPLQFTETPASIRTTSPELGQNTEEVLLEVGFSWEELEELKDKGVLL